MFGDTPWAHNKATGISLAKFIKRLARDACLCMGELPAPPAPPAPAAPHFVFLITL